MDHKLIVRLYFGKKFINYMNCVVLPHKREKTESKNLQKHRKTLAKLLSSFKEKKVKVEMFFEGRINYLLENSKKTK